MILVGLLTLSARAQSVCSGDAMANVELAIRGMNSAIERVDDTAFDQASKKLAAAVVCLDRVPSTAQVATVHKAMALAAFVNGQVRASRRSLAAARLLDPGWVVEGRLFPESHPYRDLYDSATDPGPIAPIGKITPREWVVDGSVRNDAPAERAFLLQVREGEQVVWSGYVWSWDEIPDYGQVTKRSVLESPHRWWISAGAQAGSLFARQDAVRSAPAWQDEEGDTLMGATTLTARFTPMTVVGAELTLSLVAPADPIEGGGFLPSGSAVLLLGGGGWTGELQPHASARVGASAERFRVWPNDPTGAPSATPSTIGSLVVGLEGGLRSSRQRVALTFDGLLAQAKLPHEYRLRLDGGVIVAGHVALEGLVGYRSATLDAQDAGGTPVGSRMDRELRVGAGIGLWF